MVDRVDRVDRRDRHEAECALTSPRAACSDRPLACYETLVATLLVEDNPRLGATLCRGLTESGFAIDLVATGRAALERLRRNDSDAVILDLGLPDMDGLEVLSAARKGGVIAPILVLTARDAVQARITALDSGADDYLIKPFAFEELSARLRALLRRAAAPRWARSRIFDIGLEQHSFVVQVGANRVLLSPREHALLSLLVRRAGDACSRREMLHEVFGYDFHPGTNTIEVHIAHLRRKLEAARAQIETVRGIGYRLRAPAAERPDD
jgi:DNA-binding response OmpR family regulator